MLEVGSLVDPPDPVRRGAAGNARGRPPQAPCLRPEGPHRRSARSATQIATAIHIAELRRPLLGTVEQIGQQVTALARVTDSLRGSAARAGRRVAGHAAGRGRAGDVRRRRASRPPTRSAPPRGRWRPGCAGRGRERHGGRGRGAEPRGHRRGDQPGWWGSRASCPTSADQVAALGAMTSRITGFIGTIREIADLTNLIALNAAIEAARAGRGRPRLRRGGRRSARSRGAEPPRGRRGALRCSRRSRPRSRRSRGRWRAAARRWPAWRS